MNIQYFRNLFFLVVGDVQAGLLRQNVRSPRFYPLLLTKKVHYSSHS